MPATEGLPVAWLPDWDIAAMTIVRPVPWARSLGDLAFRPERWGNRLIRIAAPGGTPLLIRRHAAPELALWGIGRASCRERVCQYVSISVVAVSLKKTLNLTQASDAQQAQI